MTRLHHHYQRTCEKNEAAEDGFPSDGFIKKNDDKDDCQDEAAFIDGNYF